MNESIKKGFNALFRTVIFCLCVAAIMMIVRFFSMFADSVKNDTDLKLDKNFIDNFGSYASLYKGVFFGSIAALVLSVLAGRYKASAAAVFFRTLVIAAIIGLMYGGMNVSGAIVDVCAVIDEADIEEFEDLEDIDIDTLIEKGVNEDRAQEISDAFENEDAVIPFVIAPFVSTFYYAILSLTSLHNLLKKKPSGVHCGGCEDAQRIEGYDPAMLNGGSHFGNMNMPVGNFPGQNMPANNIFAQRAQMMQGGSPFPYPQQPVHDHHDSAEAHDLEADGEFHNYAQAEADMTDDSSDYLSQLQREEGRGHRVTDEDFM